jgi:hypothetical protein
MAGWRTHEAIGCSFSPTVAAATVITCGFGNGIYKKGCDRFGINVTVSHYPPGCSKWNPVEYRLFSHISINCAVRPLRNLETMLGFIRGTTTTAGLKVDAHLDDRIYPKGRKVTQKEVRQLALQSHEICSHWNHTLNPRLTH